MNKLFAAAVILISLSSTLPANDCHCIKPARGVTTRPGANAELVIIEEKKYRTLNGVVRDESDVIMPDVLVEVFDHPEHLLLSYPKNVQKKKLQHRIAACITGEDGKFCFNKLPAGKYELLLSIDGGWGRSHVYVVIDPRNRKATNSELTVSMGPGA